MQIRLSPTLFSYIARQFLVSFLLVYGVLLSVAFIFDSVELTRRLAKKTEIDFELIARMGMYKLPEVGQELFAFAILFSAILAFWRLTRSNELVIVRAAGLSAWQFLFPAVVVALSIGVAKVTMVNPLSSIMISKFEQMETTYLKAGGQTVNLSSTGLWLKQQPDQTDTTADYAHTIVHARTVNNRTWELKDVNIFYFNDNNEIFRRTDARSATLQKGQWHLSNAVHNTMSDTIMPPEFIEQETMPTSLTQDELENSFASPETISFWDLPSYIRLMESTGFSSSKIRMHYYKLLSDPLLFMALVLLAAALSLRPPRQMNSFVMVGGSLGVAFLVFFLGDVLRALGISDALPVIAAAWAPAIISFLIGLTALLHLEDG